MYIERVPNRNSRPAFLLREGRREGRSVRKRTLANLTDWPPEKVDALRRVLRGERLFGEEDFRIERSLPHGHVEAVLGMMRRLGLDGLIASRRCRERDLVVAMIAQRILTPCSKLAAARSWTSSTLAGELGVEDADADDLYAALDWLLARQDRIERALARRHLREGGPAFYDATSSYYEGRTCLLARFGYSRDGKRGRPVIVYGVITGPEGRPVSVTVYPGDTGDPTTVPDQTEKLRERFGLDRVVLVGDRGMLTRTQIAHLKAHPQLGWISALRSGEVRTLVAQGRIQASLFDERNLAEIESPDLPGERLIVCFNPLLADDRRRTREELLAATERHLERVRREVDRRTRTPLDGKAIAMKLGRVAQRFKMEKHFRLTIEDGRFAYARNAESISAEEALDGIYVIRTSEPAERLTADDAVRQYKSLALVERAFRSLKGLDVLVRPIRHRVDDRVRAHIFLCLLAYYVEWHLRRAWASLLFDDEELPQERGGRDPVEPAQPSASARRKKTVRETVDGLPVHSFRTLLGELATRCWNRCRMPTTPGDDPAALSGVHFDRTTEPTPLQARALELVETFPVT